MIQDDHFAKLIKAYHSGSLIIHNAVESELNPTSPALIYQSITSAFMFPTGGKAKIHLDNKVLYATSGKMIYIPYTADIKITVLSQEKFSCINLFHQHPERLQFEMDVTTVFDDVYRLLAELVTLSKSAKTKELLHKNIHIKKLFSLLQTHRPSQQTSDSYLINDIITYMNTHYHQDITLEKLAKLANMKKSQISYLFKKYTNKRPIDYLIQYRVKKALELLETTDLLISEIAEKVGYHDPLYFSRLFKKYTGISPTSLRLQTKNIK